MGIGDWGLGIGDWGLGIGPNPQSPIPNPHPQSPILIKILIIICKYQIKNKIILKNNNKNNN
jgi:hypothetical protein